MSHSFYTIFTVSGHEISLPLFPEYSTPELHALPSSSPSQTPHPIDPECRASNEEHSGAWDCPSSTHGLGNVDNDYIATNYSNS